MSVDIDETIFKDGSWTKFLPGKEGVPIKLDVDYYSTFQEFFNSKKGSDYSVFVRFKTNPDQDNKALDFILKNWENAGYRILWKNCSNLT